MQIFYQTVVLENVSFTLLIASADSGKAISADSYPAPTRQDQLGGPVQLVTQQGHHGHAQLNKVLNQTRKILECPEVQLDNQTGMISLG